MRVNGVLTRRLLLSVALLVATISPVFQAQPVLADEITQRSLTLQAGPDDGGSTPGGVVDHFFEFDVPVGGSVGSIQFLYCTTASGTCDLPPGLVTTSATLGTEGNPAQGFTMVNTTNGAPYLTRIAAGVTAGSTLSYQLQTITNPGDPDTNPNLTFFVRIATFTSTDATGTPIDDGTVAASTAEQIELTGTMPESLIFCTGGTISETSGIPDCSTATSGAVSFNQLFSPSDTATATSQMAASTNALNGYAITVAGPTLTSGSNTIPVMATADVSIRGTGQFGMNLMANTTTTDDPFGIDITPAANDTTQHTGQALIGYDLADTFQYVSGAAVADSAAYGTGEPTNSQIYTSSYIVNVSGAQPAGTYVTTLTYVCTPTF